MVVGRERPGAQTSIAELDRLLTADERFELGEGKFLVAPRSLSRLCAAKSCIDASQVAVEVSPRALKAVRRLDVARGEVEVEEGCCSSVLEQRLLEVGCELKGGRKETKWVEGVCEGGEVVRVEGERLERALVTARVCAITPLPEVRLQLFQRVVGEDCGWSLLKKWKGVTETWERLELVLSANSEEKACLLAQLSGSKSELEGYPLSSFERGDLGSRLQAHLKGRSVEKVTQPVSLRSGEYLWWDELEHVGQLYLAKKG